MKLNSVIITKETGGYDISVYDHSGKNIRSAWKCTAADALRTGNELADYYRDENGQRSVLVHPFETQEIIRIN